jgi:hypothetical protein
MTGEAVNEVNTKNVENSLQFLNMLILEREKIG